MLNGRTVRKLNRTLGQHTMQRTKETTAKDAAASASASASASATAATSTCIKINISNCKSNHPAARSGGNGSGTSGLLLVPSHTHHNLQLDKISVRSISSEDISNGGSGRCCSAAARNPAIKTGRRLQLMQVSGGGSK